MTERRSVSRRRELVREITSDVIEAFRTGEVPAALAKIFIHQHVEVASRHWTFTNRFIGIRRGHIYAAGFKQWKQIGRKVRRGQRAFHIFAPRFATVEVEADGETHEEKKLTGFVPIPVFGFLQTEGRPLPGAEHEPEFIESLPLIELARAWNLQVETFAIRDDPNRAGLAIPGIGIALSARNLSTWMHELVHQADHRCGTLGKDKLRNEIVATLGSAVLLETMGFESESDRGGALEYLRTHADRAGVSLISECISLIDRTCACVCLILREAEEFSEREEKAS